MATSTTTAPRKRAEGGGSQPSQPSVPTSPPMTAPDPPELEIAEQETVDPIAAEPPDGPEPPSEPRPAPALAETKLGPPAPVMPPPAPPAPEPQVADASFAAEPAPVAAREMIVLPLRGALLRCDDFREVSIGLAVQAEVVDTDEQEGAVLLWIPALNRRWPVSHRRIRGDRWFHEAADYPARGDRPDWDARYRQRVATHAEAAVPPPPAPKKFTPPKPARQGFVWVEVTEHGVDAIGFKLDGSPGRAWKHGDQAEISLAAVRGSPRLFKTL